jgi:hypothetical protein
VSKTAVAFPRHNSNCFAACLSNISSPDTTRAPHASACTINGVRGGVYTVSITTHD